MILFFFFIQIRETGKRGKKDYKGGSLLLIIRTKLKKAKEIGMLPNTKWEATHLATRCAQKLAFLKDFKAFHTGMKRRRFLTSQ
jgi:hypothetical protein